MANTPRALKRHGILVDLACLMPLAALRLVATQRGRRLGVRPIWPITAIPARLSAATRLTDCAAALELDDIGARLLDEATGVSHGVLVAHLVAHERQVTHRRGTVTALRNGTA